MQIVVNGETQRLDVGATVADLVRVLQLVPERVAVELNGQLVRRAIHAETPLRDGDRVEIVTLVGGG
ncbi:MAG: sulfur carrier protein ThiS [Planctomycetota bacterium]